MEDLIFGASTSSSSAKPVVSLDIDYSKASSRSEDVEVEDGDDDIDILLDRSGGGSHKLGKESASGKKGHKKRDTQKAAWHDEDDDNVMVDLNSKDRLKKLRKLDKNGKLLKNTKVTGTEFRELLKKKFFPNSMAAGAEEGDNDSDEESIVEYDDADLALLDSSEGLVSGRSTTGPLPSGSLDISRLSDANEAEVSKAPITATNFHCEGSVLLVTSLDRTLKLFRLGGRKSEKVSSIRFQDMPIYSAAFIGNSSNVVLGGRKPFFYYYDGSVGKISRITCLRQRELKSHEHMFLSPEGNRIAFLGAGGYTHIVDSKSQQWVTDVKINTAVRSCAWQDERVLYTSGLDADIYKWDLRMTARCLSRFKHEDGTCSSWLAAGGSDYLAVGAESGAVSIYNADDIPEGSGTAPTLKSALNLTTKITAIKFHPSLQCMSFASSDLNDQLRMMHMPSCEIYQGWPTQRTPLRKVKCIDFSPRGAFMAIGSSTGKVLLYKLNHFKNA